jgi:hypothetical protein
MESFVFARPARLEPRQEARLREALALGLERADLVLSTILRRPAAGVLGDFTTLDGSDGVDRRWFSFEGVSAPRFGLSSPETTGLAEIFLGGVAGLRDRALSPLEAEVLLPRLGEVVRPLHHVLAPGPRTEAADLFEVDAPSPQDLGQVQVPVTMTIDGIGFVVLVVFTGNTVADEVHTAGGSPVDARTVIDTVPLEITITVPSVRVPSVELDQVAVGDVLRLDHPTDALLIGTIGGRPMLTGRAEPGRRAMTFEVTDAYLGDLS